MRDEMAAAVAAAVAEAYDPVLRAQARTIVKSPLFPTMLTPEQEAAILAWIDHAPVDDIFQAVFGEGWGDGE